MQSKLNSPRLRSQDRGIMEIQKHRLAQQLKDNPESIIQRNIAEKINEFKRECEWLGIQKIILNKY